ncbi:MAG: sensor hybrid histidine kinase [Pseudonocardiales bacterium]|nr:sensor hybrid histidine kinase [Pseudonocardiales bacterium]
MTAGRPPIPADEAERVAALRALALLDTPSEERFDRITRTAQRVLNVPIALITLVDTDRQYFKSCQGLGVSETPRSASFCAHAIAADDILHVRDALEDPRFVRNPLVLGSPYIRFYAGKPLQSVSGHRLGTLCVIDIVPRNLTEDEASTLIDLAAWAELELAVITMSQAVRQRDQLQRRLRTVAESVPLGLALLDPAHGITAANSSLSALTGLSTDALVGAPLNRLLSDRTTANRPLVLTVPGEMDAVLTAADGSRRDVRVSCAPLQDDDGGALVAVISDVTAQRAVERLKDEIISVTGHELRTPLTAIRGSLGLLAAGIGGGLAPDSQRLVDSAVRNTERLIRLVNDMLDVERLAAGQLPMQLGPADLADVATAAGDGLLQVAAEAGVGLHVEADGPVPVVGDRDRLIQVATNLVHNAIKFSSVGATVHVKAALADDGATLTVEDSGDGMDAADTERIFERFTQLDTGANRAGAGAGLGLAIVRGIVEAHSGTVTVTSAPGQGSTFEVRLPHASGARP